MNKKKKKPWSYRRLCVLLGGVLLLLFLSAFEMHTPRQALRTAEQSHSLSPTKIVLQSNKPAGISFSSHQVDWMLSANETSLLFGYYQNNRLLFSTALDYDPSLPYCADTLGVGIGRTTFLHVFGAITAPEITKIEITTDSRYVDVTSRQSYTLECRDMTYRNGNYYFVLPIDTSRSDFDSNLYIARIVLYDRSGQTREYTYDKPKVFSEDYVQALQERSS